MADDFFTKRNGVLQTLDGAGSLLFDWDAEGVMIKGWTMSGPEEGGRASVPIKQRGAYVGDVEGDDIDIPASWDFRIKKQSMTHATNARALDVILATGSFASSVNDNPIATGPRQYRTKTNYGSGTASVVLRYCRYVLSNLVDDGETVTGSVSVVAHDIELA